MSRRPYVRPMARNWFMESPAFRKYMFRESTCLFHGLYAVNLLAGMVQLSHGPDTWQSWLNIQAHPLMILFALITLGMTLFMASLLLTWLRGFCRSGYVKKLLTIQ